MATSDTFAVVGPHGGDTLVCNYYAPDQVTPVDRSVAQAANVFEQLAGATIASWWITCRDSIVAQLRAQQGWKVADYAAAFVRMLS